jgi:hypothetical protein
VLTLVFVPVTLSLIESCRTMLKRKTGSIGKRSNEGCGRMRTKAPWFRVKTYGYGAGLPCQWQGWVAIAIYALVLAAAISVAAPYANDDPTAYAAAIGIPTALLIFVAWWKSDAPWRWRWGKTGDTRKD